MENIQEKELTSLPYRELLCWKIWEQAADELTGSQDRRVNLQGRGFRFSEDASLCQGWEGPPTRDSQIENMVGGLKGEGPINLENEEFPSWKAVRLVSFQESWMKAFASELWNVHERCKKLNMEDAKCKRDGDGYGFSWISRCHGDHRVPAREKPCNCDKCRTDCVKKSILPHPHLGENGFKRNECGSGFRDESDLPTHPRVPLKEKLSKYREFAQGFWQTAHLERHQRTPPGEKSFQSHECVRGLRQNTHGHSRPRPHTGEMP